MGFLPKNEREPVTSNYMRFEKGENVFRVLSSAIVGMEYWKTVHLMMNILGVRLD